MITGSHTEELGMVDAYADTVRIRVLPESASQQPPQGEESGRSFDPYSTDVRAPSERVKPRRTLDDMRRLSEAIVRNRLRSK